MTELKNRSLIIASYCVICVQMLIEVIAHPNASDHVGSVTGLLFLLVVLAALILDKPARLVLLAAVLSVLMATFSAYLLLLYAFRNPSGWDGVKELFGRAYFVVLVPLFAAQCLIASARRRNLAASR